MKEDFSQEIEEASIRAPQGGRFVRILVGVALAGVLGVILGAGAYYGLPFLYEQLVAPIQSNLQRIEEVEGRIALLEETQEAAVERIELLDGDQETLRVDLIRDMNLVEENVSDLEGKLEDQSNAIDDLRTVQREFRTLRGELEDLAAEVETLRSETDGEILADRSLAQELIVVEAMLHLLRARLWLVEDNIGFAAAETQIARTLLLQLASLDQEEVDLRSVIERLDMALEDMNRTPLIAGDDLEIAWKLLQAVIVPETLTE